MNDKAKEYLVKAVEEELDQVAKLAVLVGVSEDEFVSAAGKRYVWASGKATTRSAISDEPIEAQEEGKTVEPEQEEEHNAKRTGGRYRPSEPEGERVGRYRPDNNGDYKLVHGKRMYCKTHDVVTTKIGKLIKSGELVHVGRQAEGKRCPLVPLDKMEEAKKEPEKKKPTDGRRTRHKKN